MRAYTGVSVARSPVCRRHRPPFDWLSELWVNRPSQAVILGPRGGGKSFLSAILTHLESRHHARHQTRVLGGSRAQARQVYEGIRQAVLDGKGPGGSDADTIRELLKESGHYRNGSNVEILAASPTSVRGPHVPTLRLDEVDEIPVDLRDAAMGMCMGRKGGLSASVTMTSTWHNLGGPMGDLVERGRSGEFPLYESCVFDVLERCPEERSGPELEKCDACPLKPWCHGERDLNGGHPLAKLSSGHYPIDSLIQKVKSVSLRVLEADYLCRGPRADGVWFPKFSLSTNVTEAATYDPALPVVLAIDSGVFTGAVAFQMRPAVDGGPPTVSVFWDFLAEGMDARSAARAIVAGLDGRNGTRRKVLTDPAGGARTPIGPTVLGEYRAEGLACDPWMIGGVSDSLSLIEGLISPAAGPTRLVVHPSCRSLVTALQHYRRAKRAGQWMDYPEDPQHPHEDLVDALRCGVRNELPQGLGPKPKIRTDLSTTRWSL